MDIVGTLFQELVTLAGYVLLFLVVYKLFQIHTQMGEIKDLLLRRSSSVAPGAPAVPHAELVEYADATAYAENLLRAVNSESGPAATQASPVSVPPLGDKSR